MNKMNAPMFADRAMDAQDAVSSRPVFASLDAMRARLGSLEDTVAHLTDRLSPVCALLGSDAVVSGREVPVPTMPQRSPLTECIDDLTIRVRSTNESLSALIDALEL